MDLLNTPTWQINEWLKAGNLERIQRATDEIRQSNDEAEQREAMRLCAANEQRERTLHQPATNDRR